MEKATINNGKMTLDNGKPTLDNGKMTMDPGNRHEILHKEDAIFNQKFRVWILF